MLKPTVKALIVGTPLEPIAKRVLDLIRREKVVEFTTSGEYWEKRYAQSGNSGAGSYGQLATYKAEVLNDFVKQNAVRTVIEFGSGDGHQLTLAHYPNYVGVDVSQTAVAACRKLFAGDAGKTFITLSDYEGQTADLALSLDVIYHLVEDKTFADYMERLFDSATRFVIVYSSNKSDQHEAKHVRHRKFTDWVDANREDFVLKSHIPNKFPYDASDPRNTSFADFFIYERST
ncbi:MAG: class I SAM-dependent methyltransferase [Roseibium sp.]|uniref:class I SAM-dependent methyltransferase n=1 Tax=Roseibium sp. TaxID=1936156 RepID=UPI003D9C1A49